MLVRQKVLLHLVRKAGGIASRLRLVKWAFLLHRRRELSDLDTFYHFVPYHYGPFSFTLYHELRHLMRNGYIWTPSVYAIQLTNDVALPTIADGIEHEIQHFMSRYGGLSTRALLDLIYARHPWFTVNAAQRERRMRERPRAACAVHTIGYEGLQVDALLDILLRAGIQRVIDVRASLVSRRYGYHKSTLSRLCRRLGLEYTHVPEVGIASELRTGLERSSDYELLFQRYENDILPAQQHAVETIAGWVASEPSVLLCTETDPEACHRSRLAARIARSTGLAVHHLEGKACSTCMPKPEFSSPL